MAEKHPLHTHARSSVKSAELHLLLMAADPAQSGHVPSELATQVNWDRLLDMAGWHGLAPRLYTFLQRSPVCAPDYVMERLYETTNSALALNMYLAAQLLTLSGQFRSACIPHIVYKGPLLASMLYDNLALRTSNDLDIIVPEQHLEKVRDVLLSVGFTDKNQLSAAQQAAAFRFSFEHSFISSTTGIVVDLHWRVAPAFVSPSLDMMAMFSRVTDAPLFDRMLPTLSPEDLLLALCLHAGNHDWAHIGLFTDIVQLVRRNRELDWSPLDHHIQDENTRRMVNVSLALARYWEVPLPPAAITSIEADPYSLRIAEKIRNEFWPCRRNPIPVDTNVWWLAERTKGERLTDRLRFISGTLLNPTLIDYVTFDLPSWFIPAYPVLRLGRVLLKRVGLIGTRLSADPPFVES